MIYINIIAEGETEEAFVNEVLVSHFAALGKYVSCRRITTGWDKTNSKPAKGGLTSYAKFKNEVENWSNSDRRNQQYWYTSMIDLYAFPTDDLSPYVEKIRSIADRYQRVTALEEAIKKDINHPRFIPYVQLHEFEALVMVDVERLITLYPDQGKRIQLLKEEVASMKPEEINDTLETAPSKRIIKHLPAYKGQKAAVGPLVAADIGLSVLRENCPHFDEWITRLENICS